MPVFSAKRYFAFLAIFGIALAGVTFYDPSQSQMLFAMQAGPPFAPSNLRIEGGVVGAPANVTASAGTPQSTALNTVFPTLLRATVRDANSNPSTGVSVTFVAPGSGASARFGGSSSATAVTDSNGVATAPTLTATGQAGSYVVTATASGVAAAANFNLTNTSTPSSGVGVWTNVTPSGITLNKDGTSGGASANYGVQGVHADPSRPGTLYSPVTYQGLWKSVDYGLTWAKVNVTSGRSPADDARANLRIAPDGSYMIATALYPVNGGSNGAWKSTNGGVTWTKYTVGASNGDDLADFEINPYDKNRVVAAPHSPPYNMFESRDAGQTWTSMGLAGTTGQAVYVWVDNDTILAIGQGDNGNGPGTWRGVRSGSTWPWTWSWTRVSNQQHWHGSSQSFVDPVSGAIYIGGGYGIQRSTDRGLTWTQVSGTHSGAIVGTASKLYSTASYATLGGFGPWFMIADRATGTSWSAGPQATGMDNGWFAATVVHDGSRYVIVSGNWAAGLWRYVE